jgi:hypothetical protein
MMGIVAVLPAVEGLGRNAEISAGETSIVAMPLVVVKPFESLLGLLR